jgi:DNA-binding MarR family transcriptional regulator
VSTEEPWLTGSQLRSWITLIAFLEVVPASVEGQLRRDANITLFEYTALAMLSEQDDNTLVMSELAAVSFGSLSRLSHAVSKLEKRGWVRRQPGSGGRRHNTVSLTDKGLQAIQAAAPLHAAHVRSIVVEPLTSNELATLTDIALKVVRAVDCDLHDRLVEFIPGAVARNLGSD